MGKGRHGGKGCAMETQPDDGIHSVQDMSHINNL